MRGADPAGLRLNARKAAQTQLEEAVVVRAMTSSACVTLQPPAAASPACCSRSRAQSNSDGPESCGLRPRGFACSGWLARNSAQLNRDCCRSPWP